MTFEQGRNNLKIDESMLENIVTENKNLPEDKKHDLLISLITLKYTQSNSVCYVKDGQAIGIGAGQQSRIHCTRLAGNKADIWWLRQHPKVMGLQFVDGIRRPDRDNAIDVYISDEYMDVLADGAWENIFKVKPEVFTKEEQKAWLAQNTDVCLGSDAFFPFGDNIERAQQVSYGHGILRHSVLPPLRENGIGRLLVLLAARQSDRRERIHENFSCWRRRQRTRHHPQTERKQTGGCPVLCTGKRRNLQRCRVLSGQGNRCRRHGCTGKAAIC